MWQERGARIVCSGALPKAAGVYAFSIGDEVVYVGLASRSLAKRISFYGNPAGSQRTNVRLNGLIRTAIAAGTEVAVHFANPPNFEWNGLVVSGPEGVEAGLIQTYALSWNMRGNAN